MHVRKTRKEELSQVMDIYAYARKFQAEHGNPNQWGPTNWPPKSLIEKDIEVGKSYVCVTEEDRVVGVFFFDMGKDIEPTYREITDGAWKDDSAYGVMHRLAGDGSVKGIGKCCLSWAKEQCPHLRVDTHGDNIVMQNIFEKNGFERVGTIYVEEDDYPRYAYETCQEEENMQNVLLVIDMQNDFIDGALGTKEAVAIVPAVKEKIENFEGTILFTRDTHFDNYMDSQEGKNLPVPHCIKGTPGWEIRKELDELRKTTPIDKVTFGSSELGPMLVKLNQENPIESITVIGVCTDICVISNVMIAKAFLPEVPVIVDAKCCAGVSPETHENALNAMAVCQVKIER